MSVRASGARLIAITRDLSNQWEQTRESWKDAKSLEFQKKYLEELIASVDRACSVIEQLDKIVTKIRSDCE